MGIFNALTRRTARAEKRTKMLKEAGLSTPDQIRDLYALQQNIKEMNSGPPAPSFVDEPPANDNISIVQQIHDRVFSAQEVLLKVANECLQAPTKYDAAKHERAEKLFALGFQNVEEVTACRKEKAALQTWETLKKHIEDYSQRYPLNRFITDDVVRKICGKYSLLLCEIRKYKGLIPDKNQKEIVDFAVVREDVRLPQVVDAMWPGRRYNYAESAKAVLASPDGDKQKDKIAGCMLCIMAPPHMIQLDPGDKIHGHMVYNDDPIVLQPVYGGYLIVSAWGLEAGDAEVVNAINN